MKVIYINPFFLATTSVFKTMLNLEPQAGVPTAIDELTPVKEANVIIGVTGDLRGSLLYSFSKEMALEMVYIMSGMRMKELDMFVSSALSEVANIISGNALTHLSKNQLICDIAPPQLLIGTGGSLSMSSERAILLPLHTDIGTLDISISLRAAN